MTFPKRIEPAHGFLYDGDNHFMGPAMIREKNEQFLVDYFPVETINESEFEVLFAMHNSDTLEQLDGIQSCLEQESAQLKFYGGPDGDSYLLIDCINGGFTTQLDGGGTPLPQVSRIYVRHLVKIGQPALRRCSAGEKFVGMRISLPILIPWVGKSCISVLISDKTQFHLEDDFTEQCEFNFAKYHFGGTLCVSGKGRFLPRSLKKDVVSLYNDATFAIHLDKTSGIDIFLRGIRSFIQLVEVAYGEQVFPSAVEVQLPDGDELWHEISTTVLQVDTSDAEIEVKEPLFSFSEIGTNGIAQWFQLLGDSNVGIVALTNLIEHKKDYPLETMVLQMGACLENIGAFILGKPGNDKGQKRHFGCQVKALLDEISFLLIDKNPCPASQKQNCDGETTDWDGWIRQVSNCYNGIKHSDRQMQDFETMAYAYNEGELVVRCWVAHKLGCPNEALVKNVQQQIQNKKVLLSENPIFKITN